MTLKQLGARSGLAFSTIAKIETSPVSPISENIRLADGMSVDVNELLISPSSEMLTRHRT